MNRLLAFIALPAILLGQSDFSPLPSSFPALLKDSYAVVLAKRVSVPNTTIVSNESIEIVQSLKGPLSPSIAAIWWSRPQKPVIVGPPPNAQQSYIMFLLQDDAGRLRAVDLGHMIGTRAQAVGISVSANRAALLARDQTGDGDTLVYTEFGYAIETEREESIQCNTFLLTVPPSMVVSTYRRWVESGLNGRNRYFGLAGLVAAGQAKYLITLANELPEWRTKRWSGEICGPLHLVRSTDPSIINALGRIAIDPVLEAPSRRQAVQGLHYLHTKHTLVFFNKLLDDPDPFLRTIAVGGFSAFVTGMRIPTDARDANEALIEVLGGNKDVSKPRSKYDDEESRPLIHFAGFRDSNDEESLLKGWRSWYERKKATLQ